MIATGCDRCEAVHVSTSRHEEIAAEDSEAAGWAWTDDGPLCPECAAVWSAEES